MVFALGLDRMVFNGRSPVWRVGVRGSLEYVVCLITPASAWHMLPVYTPGHGGARCCVN